MYGSATVKIWFEGDIGPASIEYTREFHGDALSGEYLVREEARKKFPSYERMEVEVI